MDLEFYRSNIHGRVDYDIFKSLMPKDWTDEQIYTIMKQKDDLFCREVRGLAGRLGPYERSGSAEKRANSDCR